MGYRYLAIVGDGPRGEEFTERFGEEDVEKRAAFGSLQLFCSKSTPSLQLPYGGVVIGHLFSHAGQSIRRADELPPLATPALAQKYLLGQCWGEYLLIDPIGDGVQVVRDPSGGVGCFYSLADGRGFLTSDVGLAERLRLFRKSIDWTYIAQCLVYPHQKRTRTGLAGISELLPGSSLTFRGDQASVTSVWCPWTFVAREARHSNLPEAAASVRATVSSVVQAWASVDPPILLELSGGLDSSIVATCLKETSAQVSCCTLVTPAPGADERLYASLMAEALGVPLHARTLRYEDARFHFPPPVSAATPRIWAFQSASDAMKQALADGLQTGSYYSGGGGDCVFSYLTSAAPAADAFRERGITAAMAAIRDLSTLHRCTHWKAARLTLKKLMRAPKPPARPDTSFLSPRAVAAPSLEHPWLCAPRHALPGDRERVFELAVTQSYRDGCPRGETRWFRMPLLSQPVVEACLRVPSWMWIHGGCNRAVARLAFADRLPPPILHRRSKGTFISYSGTVYRKAKAPIRAFLLEGRLQAQGLLDPAALRRQFDDASPTREASIMRLFELCMIENWVRHQP